MAAVLVRALDVVTSVCGPFNQVVKAIACHHGHAEVVTTLLAAKADVNKAKRASDGLTPLLVACQHGRPEVVRRLLLALFGERTHEIAHSPRVGEGRLWLEHLTSLNSGRLRVSRLCIRVAD